MLPSHPAEQECTPSSLGFTFYSGHRRSKDRTR